MDSIIAFRNAARRAAIVLLGMAGLLHGTTSLAQVVASEGWARTAVSDASAVEGFLVLTNQGDDEAKLLRIVSPLCDKVMIHRSSVDPSGAPHLWPVGFLEIPAGESVRFEPDGLQVTFMDLKTRFAVGEKIPLQLTFEGQPEITVLLEVKAPAPAAGRKRRGT
ncbi:MAG TPA: copper chaperone PCu(A)C [Steroidobacteraceae bacterium]|nr:copper chaperone PCu(A)C [Steroidobacteraceae bacterium]